MSNSSQDIVYSKGMGLLSFARLEWTYLPSQLFCMVCIVILLTVVDQSYKFSIMKTPSFTLRGFRKPGEVVGLALGKLEREVMEEIWRRGETNVREVHFAFGKRAAYTTLMTTLDRLHKKGLLDRRKEGRAFYYRPRVSPEEFKTGVAKGMIDGLLGHGAEPVLACIVEAVSEHDRKLLDELDRLVKEKRKQVRKE